MGWACVWEVLGWRQTPAELECPFTAETQFFAANTACLKLHQGMHDLSQEQQAALRGQLFQAIATFCTQPSESASVVLRQLCVAFAVYVAKLLRS